ncbi:MAG: excinuclease ABC subunit UvrB [Candidatus Kerfeldbacteria bacterium]|nr:excinuclease ABC subunit UvrB [Candidatus Kerfeldbacteria bacterium]
MKFQLEAPFKPSGDQPEAIKTLVSAVEKGERNSILLGVTGSGKTYTASQVIQKLQRPTLVISHNKTLAAQLASEFREFFPHNAVQYFVSYYDYYQPEAYIAKSDTYIEKETQLNEEIDRLRHAAVQSVLSRRDTIIVASVSCIYGLGSPQEYKRASFHVSKENGVNRRQMLIKLVEMNYQRNDIDFFRGTFRVRGDIVEVFQKSAEHTAHRFDFFGETLERIQEVDTLTGEVINEFDEVDIYPATLYQAQTVHFEQALQQMRMDLEKEVAAFKAAGKEFEAHRLEQRVKYDLEMIQNVGFVNGIENYSRYFDGRTPGETPFTLFDYFPKDYLLLIDESHQSVPQIRGMYAGDRSRKEMLVQHGFRMQAAFDNRPLQFSEFEQRMGQTIYISATPGPYEKERAKVIAEQIIRPTGITEPHIDIRPTRGQIPNLLEEIVKRTDQKQRVLVTTLTKRMAEELADFLNEKGVAVQYLHSEVDTLERLEILRDLRLGTYDVLVGINLLREGLDLPEVSLVAIIDADKEGFLRSDTSLIQTMGRAARHIDGTVIMYADTITGSMQRAIDEVNRRRAIQLAYNTKHGITPQTILKRIRDDRLGGKKEEEPVGFPAMDAAKNLHEEEYEHLLKDLYAQMQLAAQNLEFEKAATLRDQIEQLEKERPSGLFGKKKSTRKKKR